MSFTITNNGHRIQFKDEESYLNCRLEYLKRVIGNSFTFFVEKHFYDHSKCEVQSISHIDTAVSENVVYGVDMAESKDKSFSVIINGYGSVPNLVGDPIPSWKIFKSVVLKPKKLSRFDIIDIGDD